MKTSGRNRPLWLALACIPPLLVAVAALQARIDPQTRTAAQQKEELLLRSGPLLKKLSLGYDPLLADIYWTRAVQYYGERVGTRNPKFDLLWPLLDLTTTLDPKLMAAYRFGAIFLSEPGEAGAGRTDLAVELIKRGIAANPDQWRLYTDLGFLYYWRLKEYSNASAAYLAGSQNQKAPLWVKLMAARIAQKGGSIETSRLILTELYESSTDPSIRKSAQEQLRGLKAQEDEMHLDLLAREYQKRFGPYPASIADLRKSGMIGGDPVDPAGYPYVFGAGGKSELNPASPILVLPPPEDPPQ